MMIWYDDDDTWWHDDMMTKEDITQYDDISY